MRSGTGFDRNHGRWAFREEINHLLAQDRLLGGVHTMQLKDML